MTTPDLWEQAETAAAEALRDAWPKYLIYEGEAAVVVAAIRPLVEAEMERLTAERDAGA